MTILHIAYSLNEQSAAYRLAEEQAINQGHQIYFLLARKSTSSFVESRRAQINGDDVISIEAKGALKRENRFGLI